MTSWQEKIEKAIITPLWMIGAHHIWEDIRITIDDPPADMFTFPEYKHMKQPGHAMAYDLGNIVISKQWIKQNLTESEQNELITFLLLQR